MLCLDFIDPPQNHYLFHQSPAKVGHILEITCKRNHVYGISVMEGEGGSENKFYSLGEKLA